MQPIDHISDATGAHGLRDGIDRLHLARSRSSEEECDRSITFPYPAGMDVTSEPAGLGTAIRSRRRQLGITQEDLASSIGVSRRVIGQLESGKETVQVGIVLRAARAVGLNVGVELRG
jgi:DNA-binding XRE family transcriptional regulator